MLCLGELGINTYNMVNESLLVSIFGLLVQTPVEKRDLSQPPLKTYVLDSYDVVDYGEISTLSCRCSRTPTEIVSSEDLTRAYPVLGFYACPVCHQEPREAKSPSDYITIWLRQNQRRIDEKEHLYLPQAFERLVDRDGTIMRPRRFIFAKFYNFPLNTEDKILTTCGDKKCVNPYHMMRSLSPATKITPQMKEDVYSWIRKKISNKSIQELLKAKYQKNISLRTITNLKKSALV